MIRHPVAVVAALLAVLTFLFWAARTRPGGALFRFVPLLVFAYFVPTLLSNTGILPLESVAYDFTKTWLLPSSLVLLVLSVDIRAIVRLGRPAVILFLTATAGIVIGGPLAYLALGSLVPESLGDQAWKGLAALAGSWIGGGANFIAVGESVGADSGTIGMMVIVDVAVANVWMAVLLFFAGREKAMDARIGADRGKLDEVRESVAKFQAEVARPTTLPDLLAITSLGLGVTALATWAADLLPPLGDIVSHFTWVVLLVTTFALGLSFTPLRRLEGAGASAVGSLFLYLLVTTIGAKAEFSRRFGRAGSGGRGGPVDHDPHRHAAPHAAFSQSPHLLRGGGFPGQHRRSGVGAHRGGGVSSRPGARGDPPGHRRLRSGHVRGPGVCRSAPAGARDALSGPWPGGGCAPGVHRYHASLPWPPLDCSRCTIDCLPWRRTRPRRCKGSACAYLRLLRRLRARAGWCPEA